MKRKLVEVTALKTEAEKLMAMTVEALKMGLRLDKGRDYLMRTKIEEISVEDVLEAFGFKRNGLGDAEDC